MLLSFSDSSEVFNKFHFVFFVECLVALGYKREDIEASLAQTRYDDVHATYLLISRKNTDVSRVVEPSIRFYRLID